MRINWKRAAVSLVVPLAVGGAAALLSGGMGQYAQMVKPPLSPPGWLFALVWPVLYALMGYACYLVWEAPGENKRALTVYGIQLALNFLWPLLFFRWEAPGAALICLVVLWLAVLWTIRLFSAKSERAGDLLIPYILWISFALYLNFGIFLLN